MKPRRQPKKLSDDPLLSQRLTGDQFTRFRSNLGLSQSHVAQTAGLSRGAIAHYERGRTCAPPPLLANLSLVDFIRRAGAL